MIADVVNTIFSYYSTILVTFLLFIQVSNIGAATLVALNRTLATSTTTLPTSTFLVPASKGVRVSKLGSVITYK